MATAIIRAPQRKLEGYRAPLLAGDAGTEQTIAQMRTLIDDALRDSSIIRQAKDIVAGVPSFDDAAEVAALYHWVYSHIKFRKDPVNKEALYPPAELLKIRAGDCDDIAMLLATLVMAIGYPARLVTVSANPQAPDQFSHVYIEAHVAGRWVPLDAARADSVFGEAPPMFYRKRAWSLSDSSYEDLSGLGNYPRFNSLGSYRRFNSLPGLGDAQSTDTTSSMIATVAQGASEIIRAAKGQPPDPWASFRTPYTPYSDPAGYGSNILVSGSASPSIGWWIAGALGLALLMRGGRI